MKYEAVFGDYKFSSPACEIAMQSSFGEIIELGFTKPLVIPEGWGVIAMRRIIAEPKRWTVEDKKAGRLPEVGCIVEYFNNNEHDGTEVTAQWRNGDELEILRHQNKNKAFVVFNARTERSSDLIVQCMKPIKTPEEKAQREEDEFVNELMKDSQVIYTSSEQLAMCRKTARAAYRKLSGALSVQAKDGE